LLVGGLIAVVIVAYWPMSSALWDYWLQSNVSGQGVLVAALALWLVYRTRDRIAAAPVRPAPWALLLLLPCSIATLIFWRAGIQTAHFMLFPLLILGAVLVAFGPSIARILLIPVAFLYFAMPAWHVLLNTPLQNLTARAVGVLVPVLGLPATVQGTLVAFPDGTTFEVTPLCSGLEFLVQGLAVATLLGELEQASAARRLRLLGSVIVVALLTNWARVMIIIELGYTTGMRHVLASRDHVLFGTVLFVCVLVAFVWLATRAPVTAYREAARPAGLVQRSTLAGFFVAVVGLAAAPVLVYMASPSHDDATAAGTPRWPAGRSDWRGPLTSDDEDWQPVFVGPHSQSRIAYADGSGRRVEVLAVGYSMQEQGRELVNEGNSLLGSGLTQRTGRIVDSDGQPYYEMVVVDSQGRESVIWSVYDIGGRSFVIPLFSQLWYGLRSLTAQPPSVLFATRADCAPSCVVAGATLTGFLHLMGSELRTNVRGASEAQR
jgi:EpsI family protein